MLKSDDHSFNGTQQLFSSSVNSDMELKSGKKTSNPFTDVPELHVPSEHRVPQTRNGLESTRIDAESSTLSEEPSKTKAEKSLFNQVRYTLSGRISKVVASHAEGCKVARSNPGCG